MEGRRDYIDRFNELVDDMLKRYNARSTLYSPPDNPEEFTSLSKIDFEKLLSDFKIYVEIAFLYEVERRLFGRNERRDTSVDEMVVQRLNFIQGNIVNLLDSYRELRSREGQQGRP